MGAGRGAAVTTTQQARPCDPTTLLAVCKGSCGRRLHRHRRPDPYGPCRRGHPVNDGKGLCSRCRRAARYAGTIATYPRTPARDDDMPAPGTASRDQTWRGQAACRDEDPELFFPVHGGGPLRDAQVAEAKRVCARCPVRSACLAEALQRIPYGVVGGLDEGERRQLILAGRGAS